MATQAEAEEASFAWTAPHLLAQIEREPWAAHHRVTMAQLLSVVGRYDEAREHLEAAIKLEPAEPCHRYNLAVFFEEQLELARADALYDEVLAALPCQFAALAGKGTVLEMQGMPHAALPWHHRAVESHPHDWETRYARGKCYLKIGDFKRGFADYEFREATKMRHRCQDLMPSWKGESLKGRTILVCDEQGLGDILQSLRFPLYLKEEFDAARVVFETRPNMVPIASTAAGVDEVVAHSQPLPKCDCFIHALSVPFASQMRIDTIPAPVQYLHPAQSLVDYWRERMKSLTGLRVGIHWQGRPGRGLHRLRDWPLSAIEPVATVPGVTLVNLQAGEAKQDLAAMPHLPVVDFGGTDRQGAFMDTAAIIKNLDLVITSDTGMVHLAGALGAPTWLALDFANEWRWFVDREDSPWYPTMRIFRQPAIKEWRPVFKRMAAEVAKLVRADAQQDA